MGISHDSLDWANFGMLAVSNVNQLGSLTGRMNIEKDME